MNSGNRVVWLLLFKEKSFTDIKSHFEDSSIKESLVMKESVYSICGMCTVRCPFKVDVEDGVVKWIEGNPNDPGWRGGSAPKAPQAWPCYTTMRDPSIP